MGLAISALGFRASPQNLRAVVGISQVAYAAMLALSLAAGGAPAVGTAALSLAAVGFLLAPILRRRRALWTLGAVATVVGVAFLARIRPIGAGDVQVTVAMVGPGLLLAASAWLAPDPVRRSVS